jgi:hypothetical protein
VEVEHLTARLEAAGLAAFQTQMQAADRVTGGTKDQLRALAEISKIAQEALSKVKVTAAQAAESRVSAEQIVSGVRGISEEARVAARHLDEVKLSQAQATETRIAADEEVRSLKRVEDQALKTRAATGGGGGGGIARMGLLGAAIGGGVLLGPAAGPGALGLLASVPVLASTGAGALGTLFLAFQGVTKAIGGNKKAFDDLGPSAQSFVLTVRSLDGWFDKLKQTAGAALFPGLTAGLKAALSPGTVGAVTQAVTAFGHAIGDAGAQWGRYFGSSQFQAIFGPLMQAGARNLSLLSSAALHLFDAFGVLGRAAIPLVGWMVRGIDAASRWADAFTRSKEATGGLGRAMDQAKTSLQLVGNLFGALAKAVYELGAALYPVSKVLVKDLTDGLTFLAGVLQRNRKTIQDIVGGALAALVATIKDLLPIVSALIRALEWVVKAIGGWKVAFELVLGGYLALKMVALGKAIYGVGTTIVGVGKQAIGLRAALLALGDGTVIAALAAAAAGVFSILAVLASKGDSSGAGTVGAAVGNTSKFPFLDKIMGDAKFAPAKGSAVYAEFKALLDKTITKTQAETWFEAHPAALKRAGVNTSGIMPASNGKGGWQNVNLGPNGTGVYSQQDVYKLLTANGLPPDVAANLSRIAMAESSGHISALNNNPKTGDYSVGLFQENFLGQMGKNRVAKYAPQFGMSSNTNVQAFVQWLGKHPSAQAKIAYDIYQSQGYGAWSTAAGLGISGGGSGGTSPFGTPPPWTSGLGPKPKKPAWTMPALYSSAMNKASANANRASNLGNTGSAAQRYLENELDDLRVAEASLDKAIRSDNGKHIARLTKAETAVENKIRDVQKKIADAIVISGDALLPNKLRTKLTKATAQFTADSDYAQVLTGKTADDYRKVLQTDLLNQAAILEAQKKSLQSKLVGATGKQKTAIQAELTKVQGSLDNVQQQILTSLQGNVQSLQSKVGTYFANVTQQFDAALGKLFYQNGAKTLLEQQLADMQAQDQLGSLNDAIQQAQDQLKLDQQGALQKVMYDSTTGVTTNVYDPAAAKTIAADQKAYDAAVRQLDEYNLGIKAAAEHAQMDQTYSEQVTVLNKKLADLADSFQNGTGSMQQLRDLAKQYGIVINNENIPDFANLASASKGLRDAFQDLADYIARITGATPKVPAGTNVSAGGWSGPVDGNGVPVSAGFGGFDSNGNWNIKANNDLINQSLHDLGIPGYATGGIVKAKPGGTLVRVGEAGQDEEIGPVGRNRGGGGTIQVQLTVQSLDPSSVDWNAVGEKAVDGIYAALLRKKRRNGNSLDLA